ncbi:A/G-specific adenine glycosylase [Brachybacterium sp. EF45031]|nr:A/G-specific adenine glycosylase [Brachybacterium sillae]
MLQQTPVVRVLPRWLAWMERWPDAASLAEAPTAQVLQMWDRLGYPRRALRLQDCAREVLQRHGGTLPRGEQELRALPGIGEYTAAAVTSFAHWERAVVVDTNVRRVLVRVLTGAPLPAPGYTAAERRLATSVLPQEADRSARWNQAVMELGALVCTARSPRCGECPLSAAGLCAWFAAGRPAPDPQTPRRRQLFAGTDREMRGRIMALLRACPDDDAVTRQEIDALDPRDPERVERCLASLRADGLAQQDPEGRFHLPR